MFLERDAIQEVARLVDDPERGISSHWDVKDQGFGDHPLKDDPWSFTYGPQGFAAIGPIGSISTKRDPFRTLAHTLLQTPFRLMGRDFETFPAIHRAARTIAAKQERQYDMDLLRHALTLAFLRRHLDLENETDPIAVIGDGFANMASLILANLPNSRIILVNLTKVLLVDMIFLHRAMPDVPMALVTNQADMKAALDRPDLRILAVRADNMDLLADAPLTLGINIQSMMEMDAPITAAYFDAMRRCPRPKTAFYCCNAEEKIWADGTVIRFADYPWQEDDQVLVHEICPWDRYRYTQRPPFYKKTRVMPHRLAYLAKS
jgi:hypothetical protein